jgi:hypothetical protein
MNYKTRKAWKNVTGNQVAEPLRIYEPQNLEEVIEIILEAEKHGMEVRAAGSGHSWSDVAVTTDFLVKTNKLNKVIPLDGAVLKNNVDASTLFQVEAGMRIRELNEALDAKNLALINMGGYDGQAIIGAISTSTHGSGLQFGPLSDFVEAIEIVSDGGVLYRIEPSNGITNRVEYEKKYPGKNIRKLIQDDDWFNAVIVSMGSMGVIYSVVLRVMQKYWLKEVRTLSTWDKVKSDLEQGDVLKNNRHYEVLLNPYQVDGAYRCLITTRNPTSPPPNLPHDKKNRNFLSELLASISFIQRIMALIFKLKPKITPEIINRVLEGLVDDEYTNVSYKVLNIGTANEIPAYSAEIGFPLEENHYIDAVEKFLEMAHENQKVGKLFHTAPVALRFVKASRAFLSPQHGYDTCMMEIIMLKGTRGGFEMLDRYEDEFYKFSGRPHWGQVNTLTGGHDLVKSIYPKLDTWMKIYKQLNKNGTFDSPFTKRVGFSKETFIPPT